MLHMAQYHGSTNSYESRHVVSSGVDTVSKYGITGELCRSSCTHVHRLHDAMVADASPTHFYLAGRICSAIDGPPCGAAIRAVRRR